MRKMRFSPGKGNLKLLILYSDGVDIVDLKNVSKVVTFIQTVLVFVCVCVCVCVCVHDYQKLNNMFTESV